MSSIGISKIADFAPIESPVFGLHPTKQIVIVVAEGQGVLEKGMSLGKKESDQKYYAWDGSKNDGTEKLAGVLGETVDTTDGDAKSFMYVSGEFNSRLVAFGAGVTALPSGVFNLGSIVIKEENE